MSHAPVSQHADKLFGVLVDLVGRLSEHDAADPSSAPRLLAVLRQVDPALQQLRDSFESATALKLDSEGTFSPLAMFARLLTRWNFVQNSAVALGCAIALGSRPRGVFAKDQPGPTRRPACATKCFVEEAPGR